MNDEQDLMNPWPGKRPSIAWLLFTVWRSGFIVPI
jgi:hypothetical protein